MYKYSSLVIILIIFINCSSNKKQISPEINNNQNKVDTMLAKSTTYQDVFDIIDTYDRKNEESNTKDLGIFLRALLQCYIEYENHKVSDALILKILKEAEFKKPIEFDSAWIEIKDPSHEIRWPNPAGKPRPQYSDYEFGVRYLKHAIGVYHKMEKEWEKTPRKQYHGLYQYNAKYGHTWYYQHIISILSNYEEGLRWEENYSDEEEIEKFDSKLPLGEPLNWQFIPSLIRWGTCYEY